jgi:uncharacterized membrane protein
VQSRFSIRGHPIHPLLVALPTGLFRLTFVADSVYLASDSDETWYEAEAQPHVAREPVSPPGSGVR